jgi:Uma2 family endonuclease
MTALATKPFVTFDQYLDQPDRARFELVDGELVEINVSNLSSHVAFQISAALGEYCRTKNLGRFFNSEALYRCFPNRPNTVRKPDVSFIRRERLPIDWAEQTYLSVAPDLAVEVVSPNDSAYDVDEKTEQYIAAGVKLVWVVNPEQRLVHIHRGDGTVAKLAEKDVLDGEDVVPGFRCPVVDIFPADVRSAPSTS